MESMFIWIVLFSGAAVLLLGLFLVASEKELKKKRAEISDLLKRVEDAPAPSTPAPIANASASGVEVGHLRAQNQDLQKEVAALQDDLNAAHQAFDQMRAGASLAENSVTLAEIQQLRNANTQLEGQVEDLHRRLQASEANLQNASAPDKSINERQTQLESSLIDLKNQLEKSQARIREFENSATPVVDVSAIESRHREDAHKLQTRIAELESRLSANADNARQMESLQQRVHESEKLEQELRAALRQRDEELPKWQERLAASDAIKERLVALQPVYNQLIAKQNSLIDHQREYHGELKSFAQFLSASHDGTLSPAYFDPGSQEEAAQAQLLLTSTRDTGGDSVRTSDGASNSSQVNGDVDNAAKTKRGFGAFHAVIALIVGGALAALFLSQRGEHPVTHAAKPLPLAVPEKVAAPTAIELQARPSSETAALTAPLINGPAVQKNPAGQANTQSAPRALVGTYEVTRNARVFAAPTEFAQQVGEIEPGLKVNVVNARDGWLEIHSKHGRPPGFIRSDAVARVGG